jgi:quercetin dioxygenase-like cupin family protein
VPHVVGSLGAATTNLGPFAGHAEELTRRPLFDRGAGTVHHSVVHNELAPGGRVDRHMHAFEEGIYVLSGSLTVEVGGSREKLDADDFLWIEFGVPHAITGGGAWLEVGAPLPGAPLGDTVFTSGAGATPEVLYRRGHFDVADLPEPSGGILAGAGSNVGGASVKLLINQELGASQFILMALRYMPEGGIKEHDHAFEEGFFFLEGEIEVVLDGATHTLGAGDYFWSGVESAHALANRSSAPVRWLETQAPQPPSRHQFRYRVDWDRLRDPTP